MAHESISLKRETVHVRKPIGASSFFVFLLLSAERVVLREAGPRVSLLAVMTRCAHTAVYASVNKNNIVENFFIIDMCKVSNYC